MANDNRVVCSLCGSSSFLYPKEGDEDKNVYCADCMTLIGRYNPVEPQQVSSIVFPVPSDRAHP